MSVWSANSRRPLSGSLPGLDARLSLAASSQRLIQAHLDGERMAIPPPHRKRFLPLWVGYVGRRSTCVKRARDCSRALSHTPAVSVHSHQGAVRRGKRTVWLQSGISLSMNTAQPHCLPTRAGVVETANACTLARLLLADVCRLLACLLAQGPAMRRARRVVVLGWVG